MATKKTAAKRKAKKSKVLDYTLAQRDQITGRFQAMYDLLKGHWIQNSEAEDAAGSSVPPTDHNAVNFCLIGALMHINGPTEEQIGALIATQIILDDSDLKAEKICEVYDDGHLQPSIPSVGYCRYDNLSAYDIARAIKFMVEEFVHSRREEAITTIIEYNDTVDRTEKEVRAMLKRAQGLYDKLRASGEMIDEVSVQQRKLHDMKVKLLADAEKSFKAIKM